MSFIIPVDRLHETDNLIVFHHPRPSYTVHILIVPKRDWHDLSAVVPDDPFNADLFATVRSLITEFELERYRLICNGGDYQDVPILHFHLISEES